MEAFSGLLNGRATERQFRFHVQCQKEKSHILSCGDQIFGILCYSAGSLPVRYFWLPLISSRLQMVDKIVARVLTRAGYS